MSMDIRPDTSSSRSQDGWSFLNNGHNHDAQVVAPRSLPSSSYIRSASDRDSTLPITNGHHSHTYDGSASRSSVYSHSRNIPSASTGAHSTTTVPSLPVTTRVNSLYDHNHRRPRRRMRPIKKVHNLPAPEELSIQGILSAIYEDIEGDLNAISEVLGKSRFMLADQYENQLPPQGEIVMQNPLLEDIEEGSGGSDDVLILHEDASLQDGSNSGSAAYRLMERLQTVPRAGRTNSDVLAVPVPAIPEMLSPVRTQSSPAVVVQSQSETSIAVRPGAPRNLDPLAGHSRQGPSRPVVSGTYLSAEADGSYAGLLQVAAESVMHDVSANYDEGRLLKVRVTGSEIDVPARGSETGSQDRWTLPAFSGFPSWFSRTPLSLDQSAEARLRLLLNK